MGKGLPLAAKFVMLDNLLIFNSSVNIYDYYLHQLKC